jgi:hypothetical protein
MIMAQFFTFTSISYSISCLHLLDPRATVTLAQRSKIWVLGIFTTTTTYGPCCSVKAKPLVAMMPIKDKGFGKLIVVGVVNKTIIIIIIIILVL